MSCEGVCVVLAILFESEKPRKSIMKFADTHNIETGSVRQVLAVKMVAFSVEQAFYPEIDRVVV
jgi:hypothetical protein